MKDVTNISGFIKNKRLSVIVKPNANRTEILGFDEEKKAIKIAIAAEPEDDKANKELIKFVSKILKMKVLIDKGRTSREKILKVV
jgi:uncharacterized protein